MTQDMAVRENGAVAERPTSGLALSFAEMTMRVAQLDQFYRDVMQDGTDYGKIPGTDKPTLYQPGAQMLDQIFGYVPTFEVTASSVIDWGRPIPFFHYIVRCRLVSGRTGETVAEGIGSCNSHEDKYRWRNAKRVCPSCQAEAIIKGKAEYGGGWLCFKKNNGCGAKFRDGDASIEGQIAGRVENEDSASLENTISKMAQKRAHIAATLNATGASRIFTQDIEDLPQFQNALVVESRVSDPSPEAAGPFDARTASAGSGHTRTSASAAGTATSSGPATNTTSASPDEIDDKLEAATRKNGGRRSATATEPAPTPSASEQATADAMVGQQNDGFVLANDQERAEARTEYTRLADLAVTKGHKDADKVKSKKPEDLTDDLLVASIQALRRWEASLQTEPAAHDPNALYCEECSEALTEITFKDGTRWEPAQLAVFGRRKHSRILCMTHYKDANAARRRAEEALSQVPF
jgi:hypothetical protein